MKAMTVKVNEWYGRFKRGRESTPTNIDKCIPSFRYKDNSVYLHECPPFWVYHNIRRKLAKTECGRCYLLRTTQCVYLHRQWYNYLTSQRAMMLTLHFYNISYAQDQLDLLSLMHDQLNALVVGMYK